MTVRGPLSTVVRAVLGALLLALFHAPARAQTIESPFSFIDKRQAGGLFVGYRSAGTGRFGYGPGPGPIFGAVYDLEVAGPLGLDVVTTINPTTRDVINPDLPEGARVTGSADVLLTSIEALFRFSLTGRRTWHGLSPHLSAGGGMAFESKGAQPDDERVLVDDRFSFGNSFLTTMGGGVRWIPGQRLTFRTDFGFSLWRLETPRGFADPDRAFEGVQEREWVGVPTVRAMFSLRF
ncbi:MAG: hypothetical protein R3E10_18905 [Gemmatimonadota bacterium]